MKKRALVGKILLLLVVLLVVAGAIAFFTGTVRIPLGEKFNVDVSYNPENSPTENPSSNEPETIIIPEGNSPQEILIENSTNLSQSNLSLENNNSYNLTNISE